MMTRKEVLVASLGRATISLTYLNEAQHHMMTAATPLSMEDEEMFERSEMIRINIECLADFIEILKDRLSDEIEKECGEGRKEGE